MRRMAALVVMVVLLGCEPTTTPDPVLPPPEPLSTSTTMSIPTTTTRPANSFPSPHFYRGVLPDGTDFQARVRGQEQETINSVAGTFSLATPEGPLPVGDVRFARSSGDLRNGYNDGVLNLWLDPWYVDVIFSDEVEEFRGADIETIVTTSIRLEITGAEPLPILSLSPPFTWEGGEASIWWESFVIASGCDDLARLCTENQVVQLSSIDDLVEGEKGLTIQQIDGSTISTSFRRPPYNPNYLDPGPLDPRISADLIWTGEEMIVWGGKQTQEGLTTLVDGAAFDPETNVWRRLPPFPLQGPVASRATWSGDVMIVVSSQGTFGYNPLADSWWQMTDGVIPSAWHDRILHHNRRVYVWARRDLINVLDLSTGDWLELEAPPSAHADPYFGVLRSAGGRVVAVVLEGSRCFGKNYFQLVGDVWEPWPEVSLPAGEYGDCSTANQSASIGEDLVIWEEDDHPSAIFSNEDGVWRELPPVPLGGAEGPPGPVAMDDEHFMVPRWAEGAIFDATNETWHTVAFPGVARDSEIIWTGEEFLAWGVGEPFDAWRWAPPAFVP